MTDSTLPPPFSGVLHLEIRRKGPRPGVANIERRMYSTKLDRADRETGDSTCRLEHFVNVGGSLQVNHRDLTLEGHDPATDTATYRESVQAVVRATRPLWLGALAGSGTGGAVTAPRPGLQNWDVGARCPHALP
ncbi:hypothetical protein [Deinococcus gobiensis]|uniref:Uncharacterized protein n=1 Tax=Deinococcus gobiensis (strain DSM 21396 / JCM 16679 / CGMCC 1.7299 / I-0) TaxID=745776 RepID=H8H1T1_DEIGI|nr:hypothetical protein [Deinococcus gobiensis]AFD27478.1 hypothetical protein DGo_PB0209 [Deinococcus gobiensis I-0]